MWHLGLALRFMLPALATSAGGQAQQVSLAQCEQLFIAEPYTEESAACFEDLTERPGLKREAIGRMRRLLLHYPEAPWLVLKLGNLQWDDKSTAESLFRAAAGGFAARGEKKGELLARASLTQILLDEEHGEEAALEATRTLTLGETSGDPFSIARGRITKAQVLLNTFTDLPLAEALLKKVSLPAGPVPPRSTLYRLQRDRWVTLATIHARFGRFREEYQDCLQLLGLRGGNDKFTAWVMLALAFSLFDNDEELDQSAKKELIGDLQFALEHGRDDPDTEVAADQLLARLTKGREGLTYIDRCFSTAASAPAARVPRLRSTCLSTRARVRAPEDPAQAQRDIAEAIRLAARLGAGGARSLAFVKQDEMRVIWSTRPFEQAIVDSRPVLSAIEELRHRQPVSQEQAEAFSQWSEVFYYLSGRLIQAARDNRSPEALGQSFEVMEKLRARTLREALDGSGARPASLQDLQGVRGAIERVAKRQAAPGLPASEKGHASSDHADLERRRRELENRLADLRLHSREPDAAGTVTLSTVRHLLADDEALLSFQIASRQDRTGDFAGGSWLLVVTRNGPLRAPYPLPDRREVRKQVKCLIAGAEGGQEQGCQAASETASSLYRMLLEPALRALPQRIDKLIIVPDDHLHRLPFAALRRPRDGQPLVARYQLSVVPSASLWQHWRLHRPVPAEVPALVLAGPLDTGGLDPLPGAAAEGETVRDLLGGKTVVRDGKEASLAFLANANLARYAILHLATHSVVDEDDFDIRLQPTPGRDNGRLRAADIARLELEGRIVVLSTCRSAAGKVMHGEGVMSPARAFLLGHAHAVVGSLWLVLDGQAAEFSERLYQHFAAGESVAAALRGAQLDSLAAGVPVAAWAGFAVFGNGELVPLPGGRRGLRASTVRNLAIGAAVAAAMLVGPLLIRLYGSRLARKHHFSP